MLVYLDTFRKEQLMVAKEVSVYVKTKNNFKYDYFPDFLLCLQNAKFTDH